MSYVQSDPSKHRRIRRWMGQAAAEGKNHHASQPPVFMAPAAACSVQAIQGMRPPPPPLPYRPQNAATMSMIHLPPGPQLQNSAPPPLPSTSELPVNLTRPAWHPQAYPSSGLSKWTSYSSLSHSVSNLVSHTAGKANATILELEDLVLQCVKGGSNVRSSTSRLLDQVITWIDIGSFCGRENELLAACALPFQSNERKKDYRAHRIATKPSTSIDYFSKVYLYVNCRMPPNMPILRFYPATYPLIRLAAQYSRRVYDKPCGRERQSYVDSDWRQGTKAMVIKSLPIDDMNTIVFAIRGTQSFIDWAVNVHTAPVPPTGFLDDPSNRCHAGFLSVARKMVAPVAARLRTLIEENPNRIAYTLLITGHSAGGAVASLLYMHLLSESTAVTSELIHLRGCLRHIHCITFGAPPISLRPLVHPPSAKPSKSIFFSFVNEGDPVVRADKDYFFSLLDLYASPAPGSLWSILDPRRKQKPTAYWRVPPSTLSTAGRLILLRDRSRLNGRRAAVHHPRLDGRPPLPPREDIEACGIIDAAMHGVVFGDPLMHLMDLYARRIETLARDCPVQKLQ